MSSVKELAVQLSNQETQRFTLLRLLQISAAGHDVSLAAEQVVRYCLYSSSATSAAVLSLSLDVLKASPAHRFWVDALAVVLDCVRSGSSDLCTIALTKMPGMPHAALQHLALFATSGVCDAMRKDDSVPVRVAAVGAASAIALRDRPLSAPSLDTVRLEQLSPEHDAVVRTGVARCLHALVEACFDSSDDVAVGAFSALVAFAANADAERRKSVLSATRDATADTIWVLLQTRRAQVSSRFEPVALAPRGALRRPTVKALAQLAARSLAGGLGQDAAAVEDSPAAAAEWGSKCVNKVLFPLCATPEAKVSAAACSSLLHICGNVRGNVDKERVAKWGARAVTRIVKLLEENEGSLATLVITGLVQDATRGLAALSKNEFVNSRFVVTTCISLLAFAVRCPRATLRLEALSVIGATVVEFDLSGRDAGIGASLAAITKSQGWKRLLAAAENDEDSPIRAEVVCCFAHSLLDASQKIVECPKPALMQQLTDVWAMMLANLVRASLPCLSWPPSPSSAYAKQVFLKMFEALGQYAAFTFRTRGVGMEEYEQIQEAMVKAALEQSDVDTRSALLLCITKYWLTSGLKAESNVGHVLKAIWKHAEDHFIDEEVMLKDMHIGVPWSDAESGTTTPAQRAVEGGYISTATIISKRTRAVVDTVGSTLTTALEESLFGSLALRTAAAEGTTLITDYAYVVLGSLLSLVHHNPRSAERAIALLKNYQDVMDKAQSTDLLVYDAMQNTIAGLEMYKDNFFPKTIPVRILPGTETAAVNQHAWLARVTESCVYATSRVDEPEREAGTVAAEEAILRAASLVQGRMKGFNAATLHGDAGDVRDAVEGNQQTLNGASDPFSVVASHSMDTVKGLALLRVTVTNRSAFEVANALLTCSAAGALAPLPDAAAELQLGTLAVGASIAQRVTFAVRYGQGFAGKIFFSVHVRGDRDDLSVRQKSAEQACVPYYVPSSDVLLLRAPAAGAGVDVFRRRWDLMRAQTSFHVVIGRAQSLDSLVDVLERRSRCLRQVGRMRTYSHVSTLVADSSRGDYIAAAILAPEASGRTGKGPCMAYVSIRSNSESYSSAFRTECRDWLASSFKVIFVDENASEKDRNLALRPQDSFFVTDGGGLTPYQRWRKAHADRMSN